MCTQDTEPKQHKLLQPFYLYTLAIMLGILSGYSNLPWLTTTSTIIADIFIRIFKCISLPIIALSIIVTLSNMHAVAGMHKIWRRALTYTFSTTFLAAATSCLLYLLIRPSSVNTVAANTALQANNFSYLNHISNLIPASILSPFLEQQVVGVLLIGLVIGIAIRYIPDTESRQVIIHFFHGLHALLMVITRWIIRIIPIGLYGFITITIVQLRAGMAITGLGTYLLIIVLANLIQGSIILPLWLKAHGINPLLTFKKMLPALSLAFFSKSSVGTLPLTMATIEKNLQVPSKISRFILPLCTSLNMNGCAAFIFTTVLYLMQNNGSHINVPIMLLWTIIATIAAIGNAGVPMGCFFLSASLLTSMNVPITLMGIILPFYGLIDMLETALNVWSDTCVTVIVHSKNKSVAADSLEPKQLLELT